MGIQAYNTFKGIRATILFWFVSTISFVKVIIRLEGRKRREIQLIITIRSSWEEIIYMRIRIPSFSFFFVSVFFLFLFLDRSSVQFLVSGQLVQLYVEIRSNRKLIVVQIFHFPRVMCLFFFFHIFLFCGIFRINELIFISFDQWPDFKGVSTIVIPDVITSAQIPASLLL